MEPIDMVINQLWSTAIKVKYVLFWQFIITLMVTVIKIILHIFCSMLLAVLVWQNMGNNCSLAKKLGKLYEAPWKMSVEENLKSKIFQYFNLATLDWIKHGLAALQVVRPLGSPAAAGRVPWPLKVSSKFRGNCCNIGKRDLLLAENAS